MCDGASEGAVSEFAGRFRQIHRRTAREERTTVRDEDLSEDTFPHKPAYKGHEKTAVLDSTAVFVMLVNFQLIKWFDSLYC